MHNVTAIFRVLGDPEVSLPAAAQECIQLLGGGAQEHPRIVEETFSLCNTPVQGGYIRVVVNEEYGRRLEEVSKVYQSQYMELVRVEWEGQGDFEIEEGVLLGYICL